MTNITVNLNALPWPESIHAGTSGAGVPTHGGGYFPQTTQTSGKQANMVYRHGGKYGMPGCAHKYTKMREQGDDISNSEHIILSFELPFGSGRHRELLCCCGLP